MLGSYATTAGMGIFVCANIHNPTAAVVLLSITMFPLLRASIYWSIPSLLGAQKVAGTLCETMNFSSNLFAAIIPILIGFIVQATGNYYVAMIFFATAAEGYLLCSLLIISITKWNLNINLFNFLKVRKTDDYYRHFSGPLRAGCRRHS